MKCPNCGHENDNDSLFCEQCGTKLVQPKAKKKWRLWLIGGLVVAILTVMAAVVLNIKSDPWFVDLGLPSGKQWRTNTSESGFYTYSEAESQYGENLPSKEDFQELIDTCNWEWEETGHGYYVTGPSRGIIWIPARGVHWNGATHEVNELGIYWSSTPVNNSYNELWCLCVEPDAVYLRTCENDPDDDRAFSVILVK